MRNNRLSFFPLLRVAVPFILGLVVGDACTVRHPSLWLALAAGGAVGAMAFMGRRLAASAFLLVAAFFFGMGRLQTEEAKPLPGWIGKRTTYEAVVVAKPVKRGKVTRADLLVTGKGGTGKVKGTFLHDTGDDALRLQVGDGIRATSTFRLPANYHDDTHFDYAAWLRIHGFVATTVIGAADWSPEVVTASQASRLERARWRLTRFRDRLADRLQTFGDDGGVGVVAAMTLGDKSRLTPELKDAYSVAGGSHILALSGLHLSIVYGLLILLLPSRRWRWLSQTAALIAVWTYVFAVGMMPSVVRAATMLTTCGILSLACRRPVTANVLALTALLMLTANPLTLWDVGFQLSFLAVLAITTCYGPIHGLWRPSSKVAGWLWSMAVVSLTAGLGTAPLVIYYFGRFSTYFLLTSFWVVPLATLILYGTAALLLLGWWPWATHIVGEGLRRLSWALDRGVQAIASLPGASIDGIHASALQVVLAYVGMACLFGAFCLWRQLLPHWVTRNKK